MSILLMNNHDNGDNSAFEIQRVKIYILRPGSDKFELISQGVCHYNPQVDMVTLSVFFAGLLAISYILPYVLGFLGVLSIPEQCRDFMSSMICPLSYIIAIVMPFMVNIIPSFVGFELPGLNVDYSRNKVLILIILAVFRIAPIIGMIGFCFKGNMYIEFLREKWFLVLISIGGGLGSIAWLSIGILLNLSYMIDFTGSSVWLALRTLQDMFFSLTQGNMMDIFKMGFDTSKAEGTVNFDKFLHNDYSHEGFYGEELNMNLGFDSMHFLMNSIFYIYECIIFARLSSDIMCGRAGKLDYVNFLISFLGSSFSYGLLFFTFSSFDSNLLIYDFISLALLMLCMLTSFFHVIKSVYYKLKSKASQRILKVGLESEVDNECELLLDQKDVKGMVNKLGSKYGIPFVGKHREVVKEMLESSNDPEFRLYVVSGRRGVGKTRIVYETFRKEAR